MSASGCLARLRAVLRRLSRSLGLQHQCATVVTKPDVALPHHIDPTLQTEFLQSASMASALSGLRVSDRLRLYALYKQSTSGDAPPTPPNSVFDPAARHKWDAWSKLAHMSHADAMREYIRLATVLSSGQGSMSADELDDAELDALELTMGGMAGPVMSSLAGAESDSVVDDIPLHAAAKLGDVRQCEVLVEDGADVNALDEDRQSALHWACDGGHFEVARYLMEQGALMDAQGVDGSTPLHMAYACEHENIVKLLLACGANATIRDDDGCLPVDLAPN